MARPKSDLLTEREAQIMRLLWNHGDMTADAIRAGLPDNPHDSSVRTMLRVLKRKGYVRVDNGQRPAVYAAAIPQTKVQKSATRNLLHRFFGGSVEDLVQNLIEDEQLTVEQLAKLRKKFGSQRKRKGRDR